MDNKRNDVPSVLPDQSTPPNDSTQNNSSAQSITQNDQINQASGVSAGKKKWSKKDCKILSIADKVHSLAVKIYGEQLMYSWDYTCDVIRNTDPKDFQVIAIRHDRDLYAYDDLFWKPSYEKPHYHLIFRCMDRKKRIRVGQVLYQLGIRFRQGLDDELWKNHGVETVEKFSAYATYLTHETEDAVRDGKELYDISELVSNLTAAGIEEVRQGYLLVAQNEKMTTAKWIDLDNSAYNLGRNFGDFDAWYGSLPFSARAGAKIKTIRESYDRGVRDSVNENPKVLRTCIFIQGKPNRGKTYAAKAALGMPGRLILPVEGGGTGKFDKLQAYTQAIVISDDICPNLMNMADDYKCQAYRRNSNNPYWTGAYLIVTSNLTFAEWLASCGIKVYRKKNGPFGLMDDESAYSEHYKAVKTRFFVCHITENDSGQRLILDSPADRGTFEEQKERLERFLKFKLKFNETIAGYTPGPALNYDAEIDPGSLPADRAAKAHPAYAFNRLSDFTRWFWKGESEYSPWRAAKKQNSTAADKIAFLNQLPQDAIRQSAEQFIHYEILRQFNLTMIRDALEASAREYSIDDFSFDESLTPVITGGTET